MSTMVLDRPRVEKAPVEFDKNRSITAMFAKWLYAKTAASSGEPSGRVVTMDDCADEIKKLRNTNVRTKEYEVRGFISHARTFLEKERNCTIWNLRGQGWRISNKWETAKCTRQSISRTLSHAERTRRLITITDKKLLSRAIQEIISQTDTKFTSLSNFKKEVFRIWLDEPATDQKQLEMSNNGKK